MTDFPVVDTALEGFRLTRERPVAVLSWGLVLLAAQAGVTAVLVATGAGAAMEDLRRLAPVLGTVATPEQQEAVARAGPGILLSGAVAVLPNVVVYAALLRAVLQPERRRGGFLRFGLEELRLLGVSLAYGVLIVLLFMSLLLGLLLMVTSVALATGAGPSFAAALALALASAAVLYPAVRLSLAPAMTQAQGRFALFGAWEVTAGRFWPLMGAFTLAALLAAVVSVMATLLLTASWALVTGGGLAAAAEVLQPDLRTAAGALSPASVTALVFNAVLSAFVLTVAAGPIPAAYRALAGAPARR